MTEEITESGSSQGKINPRLRSTQRVRAVPYECCGGVCSFLNSGCFTMCCGGPKIRRQSSVYKKKKENKPVPSPVDEISEIPKRVIIPDDGDGITEEDRNEFIKSGSRILDEQEENPTDVVILKTDIEMETIPTQNNIDEQIESALTTNDDTASLSADNVSVAGSEDSTKKKKGKRNLMGFLHINRKGKNKESMSIASSTTSISPSEKMEAQNTTDELEANVDAAPSIFEKCSIRTKTPPVEEVQLSPDNELTFVQEVQEELLVAEVSNNFKDTIDSAVDNSSNEDLLRADITTIVRQTSEGKIEGDLEYLNQTPVDESDVIEISKVISLGSAAPETQTKDTTVNSCEENVVDNIPNESKLSSKKKSFWRSSLRRGKSKCLDKQKTDSDLDQPEDTSLNTTDNPSRKKNFLGKWGSLKRTPTSNNEKPTETNPECETENVGDETVPTQGMEDQNNEFKKKSILETLRLSKKKQTEKPKCQQKCTQMPCLFGGCANVNPTNERKNSSDSVEVKTIASYEGQDENIKIASITIIRNDFFPVEIHDNNKIVLGATENNVGCIVKENESLAESVGNNLDNNVTDDLKETSTLLESGTGTGEENEIIEPNDEKKTSASEIPKTEKKYGVIENDDFSDSLHTLIDNESSDHIILATTEALCSNERMLKSTDCSDNCLPEGIFRTTYDLSIEGSTNQTEDDTPKQIHAIQVLVDESVQTSTETLTEPNSVGQIPTQSTETLTGEKEQLETNDWVDVANIEDLSDSKFNYIYQTTLNGVNGAESETNSVTPIISEPVEKTEDCVLNDSQSCDVETISVNSCERCRSMLNDNGSVAGQQEIKCICGTLTRPRDSVSQLEEGNVMSKVAAFNQSKHPIILPATSIEYNGGKDDKDDITISEAHSSPTLGSKSVSKSATPSPIAAKSRSGTLSSSKSEWQNAEEDIDRMMVIQGRNSLSGLGLRSDSMASVYSGAGEGRYGTVTVRGQVEFGLQYNYKAGALEIHVKQCKDLAPVDIKRNRSDPYVKVYLLPDKSKGGKRKTKVKKHTLNPVFDETLKFHISLNGLETRTLWLTVWHSDMFGRNDFLGEVMMALENKVFDDPAPKLYNLQERTEPFDDTISFKGDIIVCLKFVPPDMTVQKKGKRSRGTLHVLVKEAKYLTAYKANGSSDPFCKSYLLPDKGRNSKQKTPVIKKTVNPVWNHTFVYDDVTLQELAERCLELTVWDHDRLASNEFLGGVRFSLGTGKHYGKSVEWMDATGKEMTLWKSMLERPNFWVEGCLSLRPTLDARTS